MAVIYKKLGEIADISAGGTPKRSNPTYWKNGNIPWVKISDVKGKYLEKTEEFITEDGLNNSSAKLFKKGTLLYTIFATIGECAILNIDASTNQAIAGINVKSEKVLTEYLYYFLKSIKNTVVNTGRGVAQNNINLSILKNIDVPLPEIEVQKKIINLLNKSNELVIKRKAQIEALDQLTQSVFLEMFGDPLRNNKNLPVVPLSNLAEIIMGQSPKGDSYNTKGDGTPLLNGPTEFGKTYPKEKQWTTSPKKICFKDDILFCVRGATAGRMNFADKEYCIGRGLAAIRCNNKNDIPFVYQTLKFLYKYFQSTSNGSTFINIDKKTLQNVPVLQVDNVQLEKYFTTIKKIEEQKKVLSESVLLLEENYNSIMQRAFKGELFTKEKVPNH